MPGSMFLKDKQAKILIALKNSQQQPWYISTLSKATDTTYVHTCNFVKLCEQMGLLTNERHGKIKQIKLTEKGAQVAEMLSAVYLMVNSAPAQKQEEAKPQPAQEKQEKAEKK